MKPICFLVIFAWALLPWANGCNNVSTLPNPAASSTSPSKSERNQTPRPLPFQQQTNSKQQKNSPSDRLVERATKWHTELDGLFAAQGDQINASDFAALAIQKAMLSNSGRIENLDQLVAKIEKLAPVAKRQSRHLHSPIPELFPVVERWKGKSEYQRLHHLDTLLAGLNKSFSAVTNNEPGPALIFYQSLRNDRFAEAVFDRSQWNHPTFDEFKSSDRFQLSNIISRIKHEDWLSENALQADKHSPHTDFSPDLTAEFFLKRGEPLLAVETGPYQIDKLRVFFQNQSYEELVQPSILKRIKKRRGEKNLRFYLYAAMKSHNFELVEKIRSLSISPRSIPTLEQIRDGAIKDIGNLARATYLKANALDPAWGDLAIELISERVMNSDDDFQLTQSFNHIVLASMIKQKYETLLPYFDAIRQRDSGRIYTSRLSYQEHAIQLGCRLALDADMLRAFEKVENEALRNSLLLDLANQSLSPVSLNAAKRLPPSFLRDATVTEGSPTAIRHANAKLDKWIVAFRKGDLDQWLEENAITLTPEWKPKVYWQIIASYLLEGRWQEAQRKSLEFQRRLRDGQAQEFAAEMVSWLRRFHATQSFAKVFGDKLSNETIQKLAKQGRFDCLLITQVIDLLENGDRELVERFEGFCPVLRDRAQLKNAVTQGFDIQRSPWELDRQLQALANTPELPLCSFRQAERIAAICKLKLATPRRGLSETRVPNAINAYLTLSYANEGGLNLAKEQFNSRSNDSGAFKMLLQEYHQDLLWIEYHLMEQEGANREDRGFIERLKRLNSQQIDDLIQRIDRFKYTVSDRAKIALLLHGACQAIEESRVAKQFNR